MKASTLQRVLAYFIDFLVILVISSAISLFVPVSESYTKAYEESSQLLEDYSSGNIDIEEFWEKYEECSYHMEKEGMITTVIQLVVMVAYFATYAYYKNGQTLGKRLLKIRVVNLEGKAPSHVSMLLRTFVIYGVISSVISIAFLLFISVKQYPSTVLVVERIQSIIVLVSFFMAMFRKDGRGLHDMIAKTKVVNQ